MPSMVQPSSSRAADRIAALLEVDLVAPELVATQMETIRCLGGYIQDVVERSQQKSELLGNFSDTILCAEHLKDELKKSRSLASRL
ncbi:unnamed protein product [Urochloa humidicola]